MSRPIRAMGTQAQTSMTAQLIFVSYLQASPTHCALSSTLCTQMYRHMYQVLICLGRLANPFQPHSSCNGRTLHYTAWVLHASPKVCQPQVMTMHGATVNCICGHGKQCHSCNMASMHPLLHLTRKGHCSEHF